MQKGLFILLEGPDGGGTTSHSQLLAKHVESLGHKVLLTAEPTGGPIGKFIREQLNAHAGIPGSALQLLFTADRAMHMEKTVKPALEAGMIVISDRSFPSTIAYGEALGLDYRWLEQANSVFPKPDLVILAQPSLEVCLERMNKRPTKDMLEEDSLQARVHKAYLRMAKEDPTWVQLDTAGPMDDTAKQIATIVDKLLV